MHRHDGERSSLWAGHGQRKKLIGVGLGRLWTDEMNRQLVVEHYPWFLDTYDNLPMGIMRADSCRILYMHHVGGVHKKRQSFLA